MAQKAEFDLDSDLCYDGVVPKGLKRDHRKRKRMKVSSRSLKVQELELYHKRSKNSETE